MWVPLSHSLMQLSYSSTFRFFPVRAAPPDAPPGSVRALGEASPVSGCGTAWDDPPGAVALVPGCLCVGGLTSTLFRCGSTGVLATPGAGLDDGFVEKGAEDDPGADGAPVAGAGAELLGAAVVPPPRPAPPLLAPPEDAPPAPWANAVVVAMELTRTTAISRMTDIWSTLQVNSSESIRKGNAA